MLSTHENMRYVMSAGTWVVSVETQMHITTFHSFCSYLRLVFLGLSINCFQSRLFEYCMSEPYGTQLGAFLSLSDQTVIILRSV